MNGETHLNPTDFKKIRRLAVQFSYQQDIQQQFIVQKSVLEQFIRQSEVPPDYHEFLTALVIFVFQNTQQIDSLIEKNTKNWKLSRISRVDLAVLRVATAELIARKDTDSVIITADATAIAQEYGAQNSAVFVNGILHAIACSLRNKPDTTSIKNA